MTDARTFQDPKSLVKFIYYNQLDFYAFCRGCLRTGYRAGQSGDQSPAGAQVDTRGTEGDRGPAHGTPARGHVSAASPDCPTVAHTAIPPSLTTVTLAWRTV